MLTEKIWGASGIKATGAIVKNRFVGYTGAQAAAAAAVVGVADDDAAIGQMAPLKCRGHLVVEAGAAVAVGAQVESDASGRAITLAAGVSAGRAMDAATAAGQFIRIDR